MTKRLFILAFCFLPFSAQASPPYMNIPWVTHGTDFYAGPTGRQMMTIDTGSQNGAAWNPCPIDITQDFSFQFDLNFGNQTCGADGLAFVIQGTGPTLSQGGNPGLQSTDVAGASLAICFDTYSNAPYHDPPYDSLQVHINGQLADAAPVACGNFASGGTLPGTTCGRPQTLLNSLNSKDGLDHTFTFQWTASTGTLTVTEDATGSVRGVYIFGPNASSIFSSSTVYYGFTAGTGSVGNYQSFAQVSASGQAVLGCQATPTVIASLTPLVQPANTCGTPTDIPSFTITPTITIYQSPSITMTETLTPTPYPPGCGIPVLEDARMIGDGCPGSWGSGGNVTMPYPIAAAANQLLVVRIEHNNAEVPSNVQFGGTPMLLKGSGTRTTPNVWLYTYYLTNPPTGATSLTFGNMNNCNFNVSAELYSGVDQVTPLGPANTIDSGNAVASHFSLSVTTTGTASLVSVFMASDQANNGGADVPVSDPGQLSFNLKSGPGVGMACCEGVYGDYKAVGGAGTYSFGYTLNNATRYYFAYPIEVRGPSVCGTPSFTATLSSTPSPSPSASPTSSASPSASASPTDSSSATPSDTASASPTATQSSTASPSPTATSTASPQFSPTDSPSATATPSASDTPTETGSFTGSPTYSSTPSVSDTPTETDSFSATATYSSTPSVSDTPTETGSFTASPTYSSTPSVSSTPTQTPSFSASETPSVSFTQSASPTLTLTETATLTFSASPTITITWTASATPQPMPHHVTLSVYNSAGELVKLLFDGAAEYQLGELKFDRSLVLGGVNSLDIAFPGYLYDPSTGGSTTGVLWSATNNSGQLVNSGVYTIKATIVDNFGQITTLQQSIEVVNAKPQNSLNIYNSAGELVVSLPLPVNSGTGRFESLRLSTQSLGVKVNAATGALQSSPLQVWVTDEHGAQFAVPWSGLNAQGAPVNSGSYIAELVYSSAGAQRVVDTKGFVVLLAGAAASLADAYAYPNPVLQGGDFFIHYSPSPGSFASGRLYDLSGERVGEAVDTSNSGVLRFHPAGLSGGVYVVKVDKSDGAAVLATTTLKVALVH
jgi:hypothetical protein